MSRFSVKILFFTISLIGLLCVPFLSYKLIPDRTLPSLKISYSWKNASQYSIEKKVTSKLEGAFSTLKNVKKIHSESHPEYGEIFLEYDKSVDIEQERFNISTILKQITVNLPKELSYPRISYQRPESNDIRLLSYSITSKNDSDDINRFIEKTLRQNVNKKEGVKSITFEGVPNSFYEIQYDLYTLNTLGITENEIISTIQNDLYPDFLGNIINHKFSKKIKFPISLSGIQSIEKLNNLILKRIDSKIIRLKNVATIVKKKTSPINKFRINGSNTISFSIIADKSVNQIALANELKRTIHEINKNHNDYNFILTHDSTNFLKKELKSISLRTLISFIFLFLFTIVIYRNISYVLTLFISLISTVLVSFILFKILNIDIHIYSLMALVISIGFVIDNSIIAIDHYLHNRNRKIIIPLIAATLTTIVPLFFINFLDDDIKLNLIDFSWVLIIVLAISLFSSFFLIPALIQSKIISSTKTTSTKLKTIISINKYYISILFFFRRYRILLSLLLIILFGIPFFLLPEKIENNSIISQIYNKTLGSNLYIDNIKPITDNYLGGALKLFIENASGRDFIENPKRLNLSIRINTPFGSTIEYIDNICVKFEKTLAQNAKLGIDFFQTRIINKNSAQIDIYFNSDTSSANFPFKLKGFLEKESLTMSGTDFYIFGVGKPYGTKSVSALDGNLVITGFNYEKLVEYADEVKRKLEQNTRINNVLIKSETSWFLNNSKKYNLDFTLDNNREMYDYFYKNYSLKQIGDLNFNMNKYSLKIASNKRNKNTSYDILNNSIKFNDSSIYKPKYNLKFKLSSTPEKIVKKNQEYQLVLQYKFMGTYKHNQLVKKEIVNEFNSIFSPGFQIRDGNPENKIVQDKTTIFSLLVCIFAIFSICTILLESFRKSILIILIIPITFIGLFFSLYYFEIGFNYGVFSALILLVGLLVNSSIFIINEFSLNTKKHHQTKAFLKAFNKKIIPILITIASTVVGLIPFLIYKTANNFWYSFAITICIGLAFSTIVILFILPIYLIPKKTYV